MADQQERHLLGQQTAGGVIEDPPAKVFPTPEDTVSDGRSEASPSCHPVLEAMQICLPGDQQ